MKDKPSQRQTNKKEKPVYRHTFFAMIKNSFLLNVSIHDGDFL